MVPEPHTLTDVPTWEGPGEVSHTLCQGGGTTVERIVSRGHTTDWYDQDHDEWILVHDGAARLELGDGSEVGLTAGQHILLPAHCRHRVTWTDPDTFTLWVAVHLPVASP